MREIIFKDSGPKLIFSSTGQLKQLRTGTDSFAEHNDASELLSQKVCAGLSANGRAIADRYRITKAELIEFATLPHSEGGIAQAVMGMCQPGGHPFTTYEARRMDDASVLSTLRTFHQDVAASLAWGNFAIRVRGVEKVAALAQFHAAVLAGDVVVVPNSMSHYNSHGVALVNLKELTAEERTLLEKDPDDYLKSSFST